MKNKPTFRVHVMHSSLPRKKKRGREDPESIEITLDMPFIPVVGMMIRTTATGDFLEVAGVFWDCDEPLAFLVFTVPPEPELLHSFESMKHEGWRAKAIPSGTSPAKKRAKATPNGSPGRKKK